MTTNQLADQLGPLLNSVIVQGIVAGWVVLVAIGLALTLWDAER